MARLEILDELGSTCNEMVGALAFTNNIFCKVLIIVEQWYDIWLWTKSIEKVYMILLTGSTEVVKWSRCQHYLKLPQTKLVFFSLFVQFNAMESRINYLQL